MDRDPALRDYRPEVFLMEESYAVVLPAIVTHPLRSIESSKEYAFMPRGDTSVAGWPDASTTQLDT